MPSRTREDDRVTTPSTTDLVDALADVLRTALDLVRDLSEADGDLPTDCPGWTVKDQLAHMVGLEQVLAGAPEPTIDLPPLAHVVSDFDVFMEKTIHVRRGLPMSVIADELAGFLPRRTAQLRKLVAEGDPLVQGPFGERLLSASLPVRVFDLWAHEQDIRRATGLPVRTSGLAAQVALDRTLLAWSATLAKNIPGVDGEVIVRVTAPVPSETSIILGAGGPVATLTGDAGQLTWLGCGRGAPTSAMLGGDPTVVAALKSHLGFTP
jgi:uncharacterized protein (TIGR03083 family)